MAAGVVIVRFPSPAEKLSEMSVAEWMLGSGAALAGLVLWFL